MIEPPYYQTSIEGVRKDCAFETLQGAMAWMDKEPDRTGTIYFIPSKTSELAFVALRYEDGDITYQGMT
jgi:hypothetical protein